MEKSRQAPHAFVIDKSCPSRFQSPRSAIYYCNIEFGQTHTTITLILLSDQSSTYRLHDMTVVFVPLVLVFEWLRASTCTQKGFADLLPNSCFEPTLFLNYDHRLLVSVQRPNCFHRAKNSFRCGHPCLFCKHIFSSQVQ